MRGSWRCLRGPIRITSTGPCAGERWHALIRALQSAAAGSVYLSRRIAAVTVKLLAGSKEGGRRDGPQVLTNRELEIFHLIGGAKANREIAASLGMSVKTVETHKENIKIKLGVANSAELSERAREWLAG
jgi:DNA-binding NarL/FixJ family response regulator